MMNAEQLKKMQDRCNAAVEQAATELVYAMTTHTATYGCAVGFTFKAGVGETGPKKQPLALILVLSTPKGLTEAQVQGLEAAVMRHMEEVKAAGGKVHQDVQSFQIRGGPAPQN